MANNIPQYEFSADEAREMRSQISLERGLSILAFMKRSRPGALTGNRWVGQSA
jgi:hypothetical protein